MKKFEIYLFGIIFVLLVGTFSTTAGHFQVFGDNEAYFNVTVGGEVFVNGTMVNPWLYNYTLIPVASDWHYNQTLASGWKDVGTTVSLVTSSDVVGIGTSTPEGRLQIIKDYSGEGQGGYGLIVNITTDDFDKKFYGILGKSELAYTGEENTVDLYGTAGIVLDPGAIGVGIGYGIYGSSTGMGTNWAGYFDAGDVYINNKLGIGMTPESTHNIDIKTSVMGDDPLVAYNQEGRALFVFGALSGDQGYIQIFDNGTAKAIIRTDAGASTFTMAGDFVIDTAGGVEIGDGTPGVAVGIGDLYIEDDVEVDGMRQAAGADGFVCYQSSGELTWFDGSCSSASPYLHAVMPDGRVMAHGVEFLDNLNKASWESSQIDMLTDYDTETYMIREPKPETSYIDMLQKVVYGYSSLSGNSGTLEYHVLVANIPKLLDDDGDYLIMEEGDEILVEFQPIPKDFTVVGAIIKTDGYYIPYKDSAEMIWQINSKEINYLDEKQQNIDNMVITATWSYEEVGGTFYQTYSLEKINSICTSKVTCKDEIMLDFERVIKSQTWNLILSAREENDKNSFNYDIGDLI